ncbi:MAG: hypothetical protein N2116_04545, partial [Armatimonadetes bacterium]|nr:hypothetical protein [Armatimonadota bacterium]
MRSILLLAASLVLANPNSAQWRFVGGEWREVDKSLFGRGAGGFAIAVFSRHAKGQTVEVTMTPLGRAGMGSGWASAGLCVFQDSGNYWRIALVEAPDGKTRYAELVAMNAGVWQAQSELRLKVVGELNPNFVWQWQTPYRLRITLGAGSNLSERFSLGGLKPALTSNIIAGEVFSLDGELLWQRIYALDNAPIVRSGWLALNVQGMAATFVDAKQTAHESEAVSVRDLKQAVIVRDTSMGNTKLALRLATELKRLGIKTETVKLDQIANPNWWQQTKAGVIAFPNGKRLPVSAKEPLTDFLRQGGKLIVFGAPIFAEPLVKVGRGTRDEGRDWISEQEMEAERKQTKPKKFLFESLDANELKRWRHHVSHPDVSDRLSLEAVHGLRFAHNALRMDFTLKGWSIFVREFEKSPFPQGHSLTCLWAKGAPQTKSLLVEWREADGTRWFAHVPLTTEWRLIVLSPRDFVFRQDSPTRGKRGFAGDRFNPQNAKALVLGMEAPMPHGNHTIWVAGIGTAPDPFGDVVVDFVPPVLEALSPVYKLYPLKWDMGQGTWDKENDAPTETEKSASGQMGKSTVRQMDSSVGQQIGNLKDAVAPIPRWRGIGFTNGEKVMRWMPLTNVDDGRGIERGALVWLVRCSSLPYPNASWLVFGSADETFWLKNWQVVQTALKRTFNFWSNGVWLLEAGTDKFTAYADERAKVGAVIVNDAEAPKEVSVRFAIVQNGQVTYERTETAKLDGRSLATFSHDLPSLPAGKFAVKVQLLLAGQVADELQHEFVVTERPKVTEADKITVKNGHFTIRVTRPSSPVPEERRWFAFGVNYWPRYVAGQEQSDYWRHWLDPTNYDPELVEQDLRILREIGMN